MNKDAFDQFAGVHPSHLLNGDFLWQTWVGQNLEEIGREQARLRAQAEIQKPSLRKAFGRKSVISRIMKSLTHSIQHLATTHIGGTIYSSLPLGR